MNPFSSHHEIRCIDTFILAVLVVTFGLAESAESRSLSTQQSAMVIGLTPESLIVTGIVDDDPGAADAIYMNLHDAPEIRDELSSHIQNAHVLSLQVINLANQLRLEADHVLLQSEYSLAKQEYLQVQQQVAQVRYALLLIALEDVPTASPAAESVARLLTWSNAAQYRVPPEFRVLDLTDEQWKEVEVALRVEQRSLRSGEPFTGEQADLLNAIRSNLDVIAAGQRLEYLLEPVTLIFQEYAD